MAIRRSRNHHFMSHIHEPRNCHRSVDTRLDELRPFQGKIADKYRTSQADVSTVHTGD
jgi:hypothetical protein